MSSEYCDGSMWMHSSLLHQQWVLSDLQSELNLKTILIVEDKTKPVCSYRQLMSCFPEKKELFLEFHDEFGNEANVNCYCLQNCLGSNVIIEKYQHLQGTKQLLGSIGGLVIMKKYPLIRFQRGVIFTLADLFGKLHEIAWLVVIIINLFQSRSVELLDFFSELQFLDSLK